MCLILGDEIILQTRSKLDQENMGSPAWSGVEEVWLRWFKISSTTTVWSPSSKKRLLGSSIGEGSQVWLLFFFNRFLCFLASCVLSSNRKLFQLEPKRLRDVLNQESHPSNICEILRYYNLSGCSLPSGARCSEWHGKGERIPWVTAKVHWRIGHFFC